MAILIMFIIVCWNQPSFGFFFSLKITQGSSRPIHLKTIQKVLIFSHYELVSHIKCDFLKFCTFFSNFSVLWVSKGISLFHGNLSTAIIFFLFRKFTRIAKNFRNRCLKWPPRIWSIWESRWFPTHWKTYETKK